MTYFLKLITACFLVAAACMLQPAHADADNWQLSEPKGVVRVMLPGAAITKGRDEMSLPAGTVITTGRDSAAVMLRGSQRIEIAADARLTVSENADGFTRIRQDTGAAYYQVDSRSMPHFRVDTTLLAAVVKGTGFTVSAGPDAHVVHVAHGLVEVRAHQGPGVSDVRPGETARVERGSPLDIKLEGPKDASAGPKAVNIPAIDYANASNNLLQPVRGSADTGRNNGSSARGQNGLVQDSSANAQQTANTTVNLAALNGPANLAGNASGKGNKSENANGGGSENGNGNGGGSENGNGNGSGSENGNGNGGGDLPKPPLRGPKR
jgi:hypothetical protein